MLLGDLVMYVTTFFYLIYLHLYFVLDNKMSHFFFHFIFQMLEQIQVQFGLEVDNMVEDFFFDQTTKLEQWIESVYLFLSSGWYCYLTFL